MPRRSYLFALPVLVALTAAVVPLATGAPTCTDPVPTALCGDRVIAEPMQTATFIQFGMELPGVLTAIEAVAPEIVEVATLAEWTKDETFKSAGGRDLYVTRVTDESVTTPKRQVALSLSVHGQENAGREGGLRYLEDLARWWAADDKEHLLYAGERSFPLDQVLAETEIYFALLNPDGWAAGDVENGFVGNRANDNGTDLNRQFPTLGWTQREHLTDPEAQGWAKFIGDLPDLATATDIHGELTSAHNGFADVMWPAGQWSPHKLAQEAQMGLDMVGTVNRKFEEYSVTARVVFSPANVATGYDVVGYDDSGFMGDWFVQSGATEIDVENFMSHTAPGSVWVGALEEAHVAAVRGIVEATVAESMFTRTVRAKLDLGRIAFVRDPVRHKRAASGDDKAYDVSRMDYFRDLAADAGVAVDGIDAADVATADLSKYDSVVLADLTVPADGRGRKVDDRAYAAALGAYAKAGGQLVLTDRAVELLPKLGLFSDEGNIQKVLTNAGHVTFGALDHEWEKTINPAQSQTYYEVPLGFPATDSAPHYGVVREAWEAAGGVTVGIVGGDTGLGIPGVPAQPPPASPDDVVDLGELPHGSGKIAVFGAILPDQETGEPHPNGLASYGVTVAGGEVMQQILSYQRAGSTGAVPLAPSVPAPPPAAPKPPPGQPLAATGVETTLLPVLMLLVAAQLRRRTR